MEQVQKKMYIVFAISCFEMKPGLPAKSKQWYCLHPLDQKKYWSDTVDEFVQYYAYEAAEAAIREMKSDNENVRVCQIEKLFIVQSWTADKPAEEKQPRDESPAGATADESLIVKPLDTLKKFAAGDGSADALLSERIVKIACHAYVDPMIKMDMPIDAAVEAFGEWWMEKGRHMLTAADLKFPDFVEAEKLAALKPE